MSTREMIAAVAAVLALAFLIRRWRALPGERRAIGILVVLALGIYASGVLAELPDPKKIIGDIAGTLGAWTYALVGVMAYLETGAFVGLVAPGETVVIAGGVIAGQGEIQLLVLIGIVWVAAVLGDTTSFFVGRRLGRAFLEKHGPRVKITHERLEQVDSYFQKHGGKTILIGRFIGLVRALAPFIAGSSGMSYQRFIPYSIVGTGLWATVFCVLGYIFWRSFDRVAHIAGQAIFGFGVTVAVIVGIVVAYRRSAEISDWVLRHERHPLVRPLLAVGRPVWRAVSPQARFVWNRLTPGALGLELTTALAVAGVVFFIWVLYLVELGRSLRPTPLDTELLDLSDRLYAEPAIDVAKVISDFGSLATVIIVVLATTALLVTRRRWTQALALPVGLGLIYTAVNVSKGAVDRPRPAGPHVETAFSSFPSAHAAYATAWVAVAVILTRRLGLVANAALVVGALVLAAAIGSSRIYLRAHYWSDVAGGWALGFGIFGALAVLALVVDYIRHNGRERGPEPATRAQR